MNGNFLLMEVKWARFNQLLGDFSEAFQKNVKQNLWHPESTHTLTKCNLHLTYN